MTDYTSIWDRLCETDPKYTKPFNRGGFSGTDVNPQWRWLKLTETFGPVGVGWGIETLEYRVDNLNSGESMATVMVRGWYVMTDAKEQRIKAITPPGFGSDYLHRETRNGMKSDDEAFKKATTDAIGKAFAFVGLCADVYLGQYDDSKYVNDLRTKLANDQKKESPPQTKQEEPQKEVRTDEAPGEDRSPATDGELTVTGEDGKMYFQPQETIEKWQELANVFYQTIMRAGTVGEIGDLVSRNTNTLTQLKEAVDLQAIHTPVKDWTKNKLTNVKSEKGLNISWGRIAPQVNGLKNTQPDVYSAVRAAFKEKKESLDNEQ